MLNRSRRHENSVFHLTLIQLKLQESGLRNYGLGDKVEEDEDGGEGQEG